MSSTALAAPKTETLTYLAQLTPTERRLVDKVVDELNEVEALGNLETARRIGKIIVERFFGGDVGAFNTGHKKTATYRALSERDDLGPSYSSLWYAVAVHEHFLKIDEKVASALSLAHHRVLAHVHDADARGDYAKKAVTEKLTAEQLQGIVRGAEPPRTADAPARGRPRLPEVVKGLSKVGKMFAEMVTEQRLAKFATEPLDDTERAEAIQTARRVAEQALLLADRLERGTGG